MRLTAIEKHTWLVWWTCLIIGIGAGPSAGPCDRSRKVFTEPWGIITDGPVDSNYTQNSHCEWLIKGRLLNFL